MRLAASINLIVLLLQNLRVKTIPAFLFVLLLFSCVEQEPPIPNVSPITPTTVPIEQAPAPVKAYRKVGTILQGADYTEEKKIIMWDSYFGTKNPVYQFKSGEAVVVYGRHGEYVYLSPVKDTTITGFILAGWVEFGSNSVQENAKAVADLPNVSRKTNMPVDNNQTNTTQPKNTQDIKPKAAAANHHETNTPQVESHRNSSDSFGFILRPQL